MRWTDALYVCLLLVPMAASPAQAGVLLVYGVMQGVGLMVSVGDLVLYTIPIVAASIIFAVIQFIRLDRVLGKMAEAKR